ncbi:MAG: hypothetical protein A4E39_00889 [Methanoregulaceae archaeon PtaB.Bin152]|nr:MAG: hypothetical protein A4E39_00889 [Methanoregulaceae archaeon PtaB.Bin152]
MAASTGPAPVEAPVTSSPFTSIVTEAVGVTLLPLTTVNCFIFSTGRHSMAITASATAMRSVSVILVPLSPSALILFRISFNWFSSG